MSAANAASETSPRRRRLARVIALFVGCVAALVCAELTTRIVLALQGRPFDSGAADERVGVLHSALVDAAPSARRIDSEALKEMKSQGQVLHPYFGYDFEGYLATLPTELEYYATPEADTTYDVMVLGGSVAMNFPEPAVDALLQALRADPELAERQIRVSRQGRAAFKAPQQWLVLQFLLCAGARPDAVISLDGFNELTVGLQNVRQSVAGTHPCANIWLTLAGAVASDRESQTLAAAIRKKQLSLVAATEAYARWGLSRSALASWIALSRIERRRTEIADATALLERAVASSHAFRALAGPFQEGSDSLWITRLVRAWRESVVSLHALCEVRSIDFLEVLQPTALLADSKPLTARERESAVATEAWATAVKLGYPLLVSTGAELLAAGVPFLDATRVFAESQETLYYDTCHFRPQGYEMLATAIGRAVVAERARHRNEPVRSDHR